MKIDAFILLNCFLICFESIMAAYLGSCFFQRKCRGTVYSLAVCALSALSILCFWLLGNSTPIKLLGGITLHACWFCLVFKANVIKAVFSAALLLSYWMLIDSLFIMCVSLFFDESNTSHILASPYAYYLMCFGAKSLEVIGIVCLGTFWRNRVLSRTMAWTDWLRTLFFPCATLLASIELAHMFFVAPTVAKDLAICALILLVADMLSVFLLEHMEKQQLAIRDNAILQQNLKMEKESISAWVAAYGEERKRSHDFQNQLSVLRGMVAENAPDETFLRYIDSLLNVKLPVTRYINTNRPVADVLISQKAAIAKNKEIPFRMQLDDMAAFPLSDDEMVVVLANLLDNAIEACEQIPEGQPRHIFLKIQCNTDVTYLYVENSTAEPVPIKSNRVVHSTKKSTAHGFGLQNVTTILEKHHALYDLNYQEEEKTFCFSAQILTN